MLNIENIFIILIHFFFFYFGAIMGSFLNVIAFELEENVFKTKRGKNTKSFWKRINRRSHCDTCGHQLNAIDLFPIFSYLWNMGKCKYCKAKISSKYLWIEILSGFVFWGIFYKLYSSGFDFKILIDNTQNNLIKFNELLTNYQFWANYLILSIIFSGLILIFLFDWKHKIIPDLILIPIGLLSLIYLFLNHNLNTSILWHSLLTATPFWLLWFLSNGKWMGFADWKLVLILSLFLKTGTLNYSFIVLAFWIGALITLPLLFFKDKYKLNSEVPFGPFLIISFLIIYFFNFDLLLLTSKIF